MEDVVGVIAEVLDRYGQYNLQNLVLLIPGRYERIGLSSRDHSTRRKKRAVQRMQVRAAFHSEEEHLPLIMCSQHLNDVGPQTN